MDTAADISQVTDAARDAARVLANATTQVKNRGLEAIATALIERSDQILAANAEDVARGRAEQMSEGLLDRLALTKDRIRSIADAVHEIVALPDPVGQVVRGTRTDIGLRVTQERVPLGVVGIIYEARPNVTIDAATLAIKAGNAVILRGGSAAQASNRVLIEVCRDALTSVGLPADAIQTVDQWGRAGARAMMRARGAIDALIPRGGAGLINAVVEESRVPVIETGTGNCHLYVDASADLEAAEAIIMNAKTQRVGVCNAAETLLVHADVAARFLVAAITRLTTAGVTIHADGATRAIVDDQPSIDADMIVDATEADWSTEYCRWTSPCASSAAWRKRPSTSAATRPATPRALSHPMSPPFALSAPGWTPPRSRSTPRRVSPTAASSGWEPRSASPLRSSTRAAPWG